MGPSGSSAIAVMTLIEQWIAWNRPLWQQIYQEAVQKGDSRREAYARWMIEEVLITEREIANGSMCVE